MDGVVLPGVGGMINASNSDSDTDLNSQNKKKRKWGTGVNKEGFMTIGPVDHNEAHELRLASHKERRDKASNLINRDRNEYSDGAGAMSEIFGRKKQRSELFKSYKETEYAFSDDEYLAMGAYAGGGAFTEGCKCGGECAHCREKARVDREFREWSTEKRKQLSKGDIKGKFAGPDQSFPISNATDVKAAWSSVGRAKNPRAVMASIIRIAKELGLESALPQSVKDRLAAGESGLPG